MFYLKLINQLNFFILCIILILAQSAKAIEQYYCNLGNIQKNNFKHILTITNKNNSKLLINDIASECDCMHITILPSKGVKIKEHGQKAEIQPFTCFNISITLKTNQLYGLINKKLFLKGIRNNKNILFLIHIKGNIY